jgi:hypothetical protein
MIVRKVISAVLLSALLSVGLVAAPVTTTGKMGINAPVTVLGQEADSAAAAGALQVRSQSTMGVHFRYVGNTVVYYLAPGGYRSSVQGWTPRQGYVAGFHCAGDTRQMRTTGWTYPTSSCPHVVDWVVRL